VDFGDIGNVGLPFRAEVVAGGVGVVGGQGDFQQALLVLVVSGGGGRSTSGTRSSRTRAAPEETATSAQTGGGVRARRGGARRRTVRGEAALCKGKVRTSRGREGEFRHRHKKGAVKRMRGRTKGMMIRLLMLMTLCRLI
jgi:hypothetical protein